MEEIVRQRPQDLLLPARVCFIGEDGVDAGGLKKEFFQLLLGELFTGSYGMVKYFPETRMQWFNSLSYGTDEQEWLVVGILFGLAVYNGVLLDVRLPQVAYKKLLGKPVGLNDLQDFQPELLKSFHQLLEYSDADATVEDIFCLDFSVTDEFLGEAVTHELKPGGQDIPVTEANRREYVNLYVEWILNKRIEESFHAFRNGFLLLCGPVLKLFRAPELEHLVCGTQELDFNSLEAGAAYEGYTQASQQVRWFWEVAHSLPIESKRLLLRFVTGSDRSPIGGLGKLQMKIQRAGPDSIRLPTSYTCFNAILLPEYTSRAKLRDRLETAINVAEQGFGLE
eukprot:gene16531-19628_t